MLFGFDLPCGLMFITQTRIGTTTLGHAGTHLGRTFLREGPRHRHQHQRQGHRRQGAEPMTKRRPLFIQQDNGRPILLDYYDGAYDRYAVFGEPGSIRFLSGRLLQRNG